MLTYWVGLQEHESSHPAKEVLVECAEHMKTNFMSFGWVCRSRAERAGLQNIEYCSRSDYIFPPWQKVMAEVDFGLKEEMKVRKRDVSVPYLIERYLESKYKDRMRIFTDGSKDPESGKTGTAVCIPERCYY